MNSSNRRRAMCAAVLSGLVALLAPASSHADPDTEIFISDDGDSTVKRLDIARGTFIDAFVTSHSQGLQGPQGLMFRGDKFLVVNQNVDTDEPGEILQYSPSTGAPGGTLVPKSPTSPWAPRGLVRGPGGLLYLADIGTRNERCENQGQIALFDSFTGQPRGALDSSGFVDAKGRKGRFYPRGVVFGPDGYLYATAIGCPYDADATDYQRNGYVVRFDPRTKKYVDTVATTATVPQLHRPEGLVFDRQGNLWVTSFRIDATDNDRLIGFIHGTLAARWTIELSTPQASGGTRAAAQAIVIGPGGDIFAPVTRTAVVNGSPTQYGELWRCVPTTRICRTVVDRRGTLIFPTYVIFRFTDPSTLEYQGN